MSAQPLVSRSLRFSSRSIASRMKSLRLFGPAMASMRSATGAVSRTVVTTVSTFLLSGGRPIGRFLPDSIASVKRASIAYSVIDGYSVFAYNGQTEAGVAT